MVIQKSKPEPKLVLVRPKDLSEIVDFEKNKSEKFVLIFSMERCPPCKALADWLEKDFIPEKDLKVFIVKLDEPSQSVISGELRKQVPPFNSVPYILIADRNLTVYDSISGFNKNEFQEFYMRNL